MDGNVRLRHRVADEEAYAPCLQPQSAGAVCSTGLPNTTVTRHLAEES